jgi:hypothetical protein
MFQGAGMARERKSLFFIGACRCEAKKCSDNMKPVFVGNALVFG